MTTKIVLCCAEEYNSPAVIANRIQKLARGLAHSGNSVRVLGAGKKDDATWRVDEYGIPYRNLAIVRETNRLRKYGQLTAFSRRCSTSIAEQVTQEGVDIVIIYGGSHVLSRFAMELREVAGFKVVVDCTEWPPFRVPRLASPFFADQVLFRLRTLPKLDGVIAISTLWEDYCRRRGADVIRIPSLGEIGPVLRSERKAGDPFRVGYVGPMSKRDLPELMVDSFEKVIASTENIVFRLVGKWDSFRAGRQAVQRIRNSPSLARRVEVVGWVEPRDFNRVIGEIDAFILLRPNTLEARACFPTRLPEFLLRAKPVILSDVGDMRMYFEDKQGALLVSHRATSDEIAKGIAWLAANPEQAQAIGYSGYLAGQKNFGYISHGQLLSEFLAHLRPREVVSRKVTFVR